MFVYSGLVWVQYTACREGICRAAICVRCTFVLHHSTVLRYRQSHRLHSESRCVATTIEVRRAEYSQHNDSKTFPANLNKGDKLLHLGFFFKAHFRKKSNVTKSDRHKSINKPKQIKRVDQRVAGTHTANQVKLPLGAREAAA